MIGQDFEGVVAELQSQGDWDARLAEATNPDVQMPSYYTQPFHAYAEGRQGFHGTPAHGSCCGWMLTAQRPRAVCPVRRSCCFGRRQAE